ncbi:MAG: hypothetical protein ABEK04_00740 [Candidatus Nanohalobium sp.]
MQDSENKPERAKEYLEERFGVKEEELEGLKLKEVSGDVWLKSVKGSGLEAETFGIRAVRFMDIGLKPTTYVLQLLGDRITEARVEVNEQEFRTLLEGDMIEREMGKQECSCEEPSDKDEEWNCCGRGYVAIVFEGEVYGCGFYMDELVSSRIPEGRADELLGTL